MAFLRNDLEYIKNNSPEILENYRQEFEQASDDQYYGLRTEIGITASLLKKDLDIVVQESPDYEIRHRGGSIAAEATSKHLSDLKDRDLTYQVLRAIRTKCEKDYSSPNTILFVDITNVLWSMMAMDRKFDTDELKQSIRDEMQDDDYGTVLLLGYYGDESSFRRVYVRVDNNPTDDLEEFLAEYYPFEELDPGEISQPPAG
jgi:hypothetical protein